MTGDPRRWMWAEACSMIERAEQLHRQFFQPGFAAAPGACWEPPVDIFETDRELWIVVALPGVAAGQVEIVIAGGVLVVTGERSLPIAGRHSRHLPAAGGLLAVAIGSTYWTQRF
jgi:HSP20 family molecular chaperone IbpA